MSGGHFDYGQYRITEIADSIESEIYKNGKQKTKDQLRDENWINDEWYKKYPEDLYFHKYPDEVIEEFKKGVAVLRKAAIYAQRIDWLLSGDDGEDTFLIRLNEELEKL